MIRFKAQQIELDFSNRRIEFQASKKDVLVMRKTKKEKTKMTNKTKPAPVTPPKRRALTAEEHDPKLDYSKLKVNVPFKAEDGWTVVREPRGYGMRARRVDPSPMTSVVILEWTHPNYGFWADAAVFIKTAHMRDWEEVWVVNWSEVSKADARLKFKDLLHFTEERAFQAMHVGGVKM